MDGFIQQQILSEKTKHGNGENEGGRRRQWQWGTVLLTVDEGEQAAFV